MLITICLKTLLKVKIGVQICYFTTTVKMQKIYHLSLKCLEKSVGLIDSRKVRRLTLILK